MSGWIGAQTYLREKTNQTDFSGLNLLVQGDVPPGSGLSSSSAFVSASVLTSLIAYTGKLFDGYSKEELAEIAIRSEKFVGTEGLLFVFDI